MRPEHPRTTEFGNWLCTVRTDCGETVVSLAKKAGVAASSVSDVERGKRNLTIRMARRLAGPLGLHANELLVRGRAQPEFSWEKAVAPPPGKLKDLQMKVTPDEQRKLAEYLEFLRLKRSMSNSQTSSGTNDLSPTYPSL